ncbi:hypothetical protein SAMN05660236_1519 [Ohtaekwangia koreensis]|uniref:Uncharacterized protein n=1 Tax=Ohtaekwangia koreensis TaxID=688867 RepID=A0A1T5JUP5_9BACT|nr:hypothetical protein SAMN05660236_1519 [Ohtaekwangia koreensis]
MKELLDALSNPWPWYIVGPLIGLTVPLLLVLGNKPFGISSTLRHICAACVPMDIPFFQYPWRKEIWNLLFVVGIFMGAIIATTTLSSQEPVQVTDELRAELAAYGITDMKGLVPKDLFNLHNLFTLKGFILMIAGGFLVGFGTRYAGGCTSGHAITGLSNLQWPSLIATICFMIGGIVVANFVLPYILRL